MSDSHPKKLLRARYRHDLIKLIQQRGQYGFSDGEILDLVRKELDLEEKE